MGRVRETFAARKYGEVLKLLEEADGLIEELSGRPQEEEEGPAESEDFYIKSILESSKEDVEKICKYFGLTCEGYIGGLRAEAIGHLLGMDLETEEGTEPPSLTFNMVEDADRAHLMVWCSKLGLPYDHPSDTLRKRLLTYLGPKEKERKPKKRDEPEKSGKKVKSKGPDRPEKQQKPEKSEKPDEPNAKDKLDRQDKRDKQEKPEKPKKPVLPEKKEDKNAKEAPKKTLTVEKKKGIKRDQGATKGSADKEKKDEESKTKDEGNKKADSSGKGSGNMADAADTSPGGSGEKDGGPDQMLKGSRPRSGGTKNAEEEKTEPKRKVLTVPRKRK
jgi:hypothetical protein